MTPQPWYWNVDEVESATSNLATLYPTHATLIGQLEPSADLKRNCHALRLALDPQTAKPTLVVVGGIHGVEWGSCEIVVNFATDLLKAREGGGFGLAYPNVMFSAAQVASILDNIDIVIFPLVNPDGREFSQRKARAFEEGDTWRKNRNQAYAGGVPEAFGVDINRNFEFLFDFDTAFLPNHFGSGVSLPAELNFRGPSAFSEPETRNVRALLDRFPSTRWMIDVHSNWQLIRHPWSDDTVQFTDSKMNFANSAFDKLRGESGGYAEYMPATDLTEYQRLGQAISTAMTAVAHRPHPVESGFAWGPSFGMSYDYAYSRERAEAKGKIFGFLLEWGDKQGRPNPDWIDMEGTYLPEAVAGLVSFCVAASSPPAPPRTPP